MTKIYHPFTGLRSKPLHEPKGSSRCMKKAGDFSPASVIILIRLCKSLTTNPVRLRHWVGSSDNANVLCTWALRTLSFGVLNALTFLKIIELESIEI